LLRVVKQPPVVLSLPESKMQELKVATNLQRLASCFVKKPLERELTDGPAQGPEFRHEIGRPDRHGVLLFQRKDGRLRGPHDGFGGGRARTGLTWRLGLRAEGRVPDAERLGVPGKERGGEEGSKQNALFHHPTGSNPPLASG